MIELLKKPVFLVNFLTGIIFIIAALVQIKFPPKKINSLYGYRTKNSMKSNEAWEFAQKFSAKIMLKFGIGLCFLAIILKNISFSKAEYEVVLATFIITFVVVIMLVIVEKELKKRF